MTARPRGVVTRTLRLDTVAACIGASWIFTLQDHGVSIVVLFPSLPSEPQPLPKPALPEAEVNRRAWILTVLTPYFLFIVALALTVNMVLAGTNQGAVAAEDV